MNYIYLIHLSLLLNLPYQIKSDIIKKNKIPEIERNPRTGVYIAAMFDAAFVSQLEEFDYYIEDIHIDGEIPMDISGSLFRNRPARFERGTYVRMYNLFYNFFIVNFILYRTFCFMNTDFYLFRFRPIAYFLSLF